MNLSLHYSTPLIIHFDLDKEVGFELLRTALDHLGITHLPFVVQHHGLSDWDAVSAELQIPTAASPPSLTHFQLQILPPPAYEYESEELGREDFPFFY